MKHVAFVLFAVLATACAHNPQPQTQAVNTHTAEWQPPTDFEFSWDDKGNHRVPTTPTPTTTTDREEQKYQESLNGIYDQMQDENLQLLMTEESHGKSSTYYRNLLHQLCQVDMLMDSKGNGHLKSYCHQK